MDREQSSRKLKLRILSENAVNSQIVTAVSMYCNKNEVPYELAGPEHSQNPLENIPALILEYRGRTAVYDMMDGYQATEAISYLLEQVDVYFKRSFSEKENLAFGDLSKKIVPLGLNYYITCRGNPLNEPVWKSLAKRLIGRTPESAFKPAFYESPPRDVVQAPKIMYWARLWEPQEGLSIEVAEQRYRANEMRVAIVRALKKEFGSAYIGGLYENNLARKTAPELIVGGKIADKGNYIRRLRECDIGIATEGLHRSYGWKVAEYVASSLAIVIEKPYYELPGDFTPSENYLLFETADECIEAVSSLLGDQDTLLRMKAANHRYYTEYVEPIAFIARTLSILEAREQ